MPMHFGMGQGTACLALHSHARSQEMPSKLCVKQTQRLQGWCVSANSVSGVVSADGALLSPDKEVNISDLQKWFTRAPRFLKNRKWLATACVADTKSNSRAFPSDCPWGGSQLKSWTWDWPASFPFPHASSPFWCHILLTPRTEEAINKGGDHFPTRSCSPKS